mgnify:CR=1 FL=1
MSNLPTTTAAEVLDISPEALEIANCYLVTQDLQTVATELDLPPETVSQILNKREVKAYIDNVFFNIGFNNRFRMHAAMDAVIRKKFQELEESDMGSTKDIAELLALKHKMTMDEKAKDLEILKLQQSSIKNQVNVQINEGLSDGTKYGDLIQRLMNGTQI